MFNQLGLYSIKIPFNGEDLHSTNEETNKLKST